MRSHLERINRGLGRLIFRTAGLACALLAAFMCYLAWLQFSDPQDQSLVGAILFAAAGAAAASVVPFCFSRNRTLVEALDAMEDSTPGLPVRKPTKRRSE